MSQNPSAHTPLTAVRKIEADGVQVFYRAAGDPSAPVVLLLHGFPISSFMFRELIPRLADHYRVIAPDLPGFGFIITIMVLELKPPPEPSFAALLPLWPTGVSYLFIAIVWVNHHHLLRFAFTQRRDWSGGISRTFSRSRSCPFRPRGSRSRASRRLL